MPGLTPSSRALDPIAAVVLFGMGALLIALGNFSQYGPDFPLWMRIVPMALVSLGVALRRTAPLTCLGIGTIGVAIDLLLGVSWSVVIVYTDNLYAAALYGRRRAMRVLPVAAVAAALALATAVALLGGDFADVLVTLAIWVGVMLSPMATAVIVRQARERADLEAARAEQESRLSELRRHEAVLLERTRMARELHDTVANYLSAIALQATGIQARRNLDSATLDRSVAEIRQSSVEGLAELRRIIRLLRDGDGEDELASYRLDQLPGLIERMRTAGLDVVLTATGDPQTFPGEVETVAYRVVQEALTNALKYGSNAVVALDYASELLAVSVENDVGAANGSIPGGGSGLLGMTERVRLLGGTVRAGLDGGRWRVHARIPTGSTAEGRGIGVTVTDESTEHRSESR